MKELNNLLNLIGFIDDSEYYMYRKVFLYQTDVYRYELRQYLNINTRSIGITIKPILNDIDNPVKYEGELFYDKDDCIEYIRKEFAPIIRKRKIEKILE